MAVSHAKKVALGTTQSRPSSDVAAGGWTTAPLFSKVNEVTADDVTTEILSAVLSAVGNTGTVTLGLPTVTRIINTGWKVYVRARSVVAASGAGSMTIQLLEGVTVRSSVVVAAPLSGTYTTYTLTLTEAEAANIVDLTTLRIGIFGSMTNAPITSTFQVRVTQAYLELPSSGDGGDATLIRPSDWNANHTIDNGTILKRHLAANASGFNYLGGIELGTAAATTGVLTIEAVDILLIQGNIGGIPTPGDQVALRFNQDTGSNYTWRTMKATSGLLGDLIATFSNVQAAPATQIQLHSDAEMNARNLLMSMSNRAGTTQVGGFMPAIATGSASTRGLVNLGSCEYHGPDVITQVEMRTVSGGLMDAGSILMVFGKALP